MKIQKIPFILLVLLIFSLNITGCTTFQRPNPGDQTRLRQNIEENNNTTPNLNNGVTDDSVNNPDTNIDYRTRDNIMPDQPAPVTPTSEAGFTLDQINKFELDVELINNDKVDMQYKKGPSNKESKVETVFDGKTEKLEHEKASRQIEKLLREIPGASISDTNKIIDGTLSALKIKREDVVEFDMEFVFETGEKVHIEFNK